ncbi:MAG: MarR family transcriptional regulator [Pseudomonadota bacterium]
MSRELELLDIVRTLMRVMLVSERTPPDHQHEMRYNALDFQVIGLVRGKPGIHVTEIVQQLGIAPTTASSVIGRLVERDVLSRARSAEDRRAYALSLTEEGQMIADTIHGQDLRNMALFLSTLAPDEQAELIRLLGKVSDRVSALER